MPFSFRIFFPLWVIISLFPGQCAAAAHTMNLQQCLRRGLQNNATLQAARFKAEASGKDVNAARADFLPAISSSFSSSQIDSISAKGPTNDDYINQDVHSANIKLSQILYAGARLVNTHDKAKLLEQAAKAEMELSRLELTYNIESTFYKVMKAKQDVLASTEAVHRLEESAKAAEAFFSKELVPYVDVLSAKVDLADAESQLGVAKNEHNRQRMALFALMNTTMDDQVEFIDGTDFTLGTRPSFGECFKYALNHRPDLKDLEYQRQAANKDAAIALGKYLPVVRLEGGYYDYTTDYKALGTTSYGIEYDRDQRNRYWLVGVTATWDLFDGGRAWYENEKSDLQARRFGSLLQEARNTIVTGIHKALYSMAEAEQRLNGSTKALAAAQENYAAEKKRLKAGVSTITNLLDAQARLVRAQANQSNATMDYQLAQSELNFMTGGQFSKP